MKRYNILSYIKDLLSGMNAKKIIIIIIALALIITPTVLAGAYILYREFYHDVNVFSVTLYDSNNAIIISEEKDPESSGRSSLTNIFYTLTRDPKPITTEIEADDTKTFIRAATSYKDTPLEIKCYFSTDTDTDGYFVDESGQKFTIPEELNKAFLSTAYGEMFYDAAVPYSLSTLDLDVITPSEISWYYKNINGEYLSATRNETTPEQRVYEITGAIDLSFDTDPDDCRARVYQGDRRVYDGTLSKLSELTVDHTEDIRVDITAKWSRVAEKQAYGEITYKFLVRIKNRSSFSISSDEVSAGGFLILDCTNITDISKIKFSSNIKGISPVFERYNGMVRAVIPFEEEIKYDSFDFEISYGAASESFNVSILPTDKAKTYSSSSMLYRSKDEPTKLNEYIKKLVISAELPKNDLVYFHGNFISPEELGYVTVYTHNSTVIWGEKAEHSFTALGNEYAVSAEGARGSSVSALQNGVIAYAGNDKQIGDYIVIDHGCGLRTWYMGLSDIDVKVGDIVLSGQHIGKTAQAAATGDDGFRLLCTAYDTVIDPNTLWK